MLALVSAVAVLASVPASAYTRPGQTIRVSLTTRGGQTATWMGDCAPRARQEIDMTPSARFVAFATGSTNVVPFDTNNACDIFIRDRSKGTTVRASVQTGGAQASTGVVPADGRRGLFPHSFAPSLSDDGRFVAFASMADDLVPGDTNVSTDVFVHDMKENVTKRVSVTSGGAQAKAGVPFDGDLSTNPSISGNGKWLCFMSYAPNLPHAGAGGVDYQIYLHNVVTGRTVWVGPGVYCSMDARGNDVVYSQTDTGLVFLFDRRTGKTITVSTASDGSPPAEVAPAASVSGGESISADDRYVVFSSSAGNLVPNDTNGINTLVRTTYPDVFVKDLKTGRTTRVSVDSYGEQGDLPADQEGFGGGEGANSGELTQSISASGRWVAFTTMSYPQLFPPGQASRYKESFVYDTRTGQLDWTSATPRGHVSSRHCNPGPLFHYAYYGSFAGPISANGQFALLTSCGEDLVRGDTNESWDVFVRDRGPELGSSLGQNSGGGGGGSGGPPIICIPTVICIPPQGAIASRDPVGDVLPSVTRQGLNLTGVSVAYRPQYRDLFVREELQSMPTVSGTPLIGHPLALYGLDFRARGERYQVRVQRVPGPDFDAAGGASFGLFRYDPSLGIWTHVASLRGGYGTTGEEVVFSIPLGGTALPVNRHVEILRGLTAFTSIGTYASGPAAVLDTLRVR